MKKVRFKYYYRVCWLTTIQTISKFFKIISLIKLRWGSLVLLVLFMVISGIYWLHTSNDTTEYIVSKIKSEDLKRTPEKERHLGSFESKEERRLMCSPGEEGKPLSEYGLNIACSDEISLNRSIPDTRLSECKLWNYPEYLPKTSVIIVFHNEGWSTLIRTVHSVINRTPPQILKEILLVDDFSDKENLKNNLDQYIVRFGGIVRLIRNKERKGLISTKTRGARKARGEVILFLDAHCEVNINWLPPLLTPIYRDNTIMTVPIIDEIDRITFQYRPDHEEGRHYRGIFDWCMNYKEKELPTRETNKMKHYSDPYKSPTHSGGLFAINRDFFFSLGAYDPELWHWGGENFELSFKIWQCGGSIEWVPCSRVGHVHKPSNHNYFEFIQSRKAPIIDNYKRVVETWFDPIYKEYYYTCDPISRYVNLGDITDQLALKEILKCRSFQWYMENVAYDVFEVFPEPPENIHWGELFNVATLTCMDTMGREPPALMGMLPCNGYGGDQLIRLNAKGQLGVRDMCISAGKHGIKLVSCRKGTVNGPWEYNEENHTLHHRTRNKCVALNSQTFNISLKPCDKRNSYHIWLFKKITLH